MNHLVPPAIGARVMAVGAVAVLPLLVACVGGTSRGAALYPTRGDRPPVETVAQLYGDIATVDGASMSGRGRSFELLPGCHVVTTRTSWGERDHSGTMSGNMPMLTYVVQMQPNRSYVLEYDLANRTGNGGTLVFTAKELDANGNTLAQLQPAASDADVARCSATGKSER